MDCLLCNTNCWRRSSIPPLQGEPWERRHRRVCVPASGSSPAVSFLFELTARACISLLLMDHRQKASAPFCFGKREGIPQFLFVYFEGFCVCVCVCLTYCPMKHVLVVVFLTSTCSDSSACGLETIPRQTSVPLQPNRG